MLQLLAKGPGFRATLIFQKFKVIVASIDKEHLVIMTHQNLYLGKCWKLF